MLMFLRLRYGETIVVSKLVYRRIDTTLPTVNTVLGAVTLMTLRFGCILHGTNLYVLSYQ